MKSSSAHAALAFVVAICRIPVSLAFVSPVTALSCISNIHGRAASSGATVRNDHAGSASSRPAYSNAAAAAAAGRSGAFRLAAAREDCKSCMEKELLEQELENRVEVDGRETRRAAFDEVCKIRRTCHLPPSLLRTRANGTELCSHGPYWKNGDRI